MSITLASCGARCSAQRRHTQSPCSNYCSLLLHPPLCMQLHAKADLHLTGHQMTGGQSPLGTGGARRKLIGADNGMASSSRSLPQALAAEDLTALPLAAIWLEERLKVRKHRSRGHPRMACRAITPSLLHARTSKPLEATRLSRPRVLTSNPAHPCPTDRFACYRLCRSSWIPRLVPAIGVTDASSRCAPCRSSRATN